MNTTLIVAIIGAVAVVIAAWVGKTRKAKEPTARPDAYEGLAKALYQVRSYAAEIRHLLSNDPGPSFQEDIIDASRGFRDANDHLQACAGSNRPFLDKETFQAIVDLIEASAALIEALRKAMSGTASTKEVVEELNRCGKSVQYRLRQAEECLDQGVAQVSHRGKRP